MRGACVAFATCVLVACSGSGEGAPEGEAIACGLQGAVELNQQCRLERVKVEGAQVFVVRHPDGGFRRLEVSANGQNLLAADGAEVTQSALKGDRWEVILSEVRYVIPVKANAPSE